MLTALLSSTTATKSPVINTRPAVRVFSPSTPPVKSPVVAAPVNVPKARESLACSPAWVRINGIDRRSVPFNGQGETIQPYLGWLLLAFGIDYEEVECTDGCYLVAYAYGEPPLRAERDSVMFVLYREKDSDGFYVMDGYNTFTPDQCAAEIQAHGSTYRALNAHDAMAAMAELLYLPPDADYSSVMMAAWNTRPADLNYWHGKDRGPWDWK